MKTNSSRIIALPLLLLCVGAARSWAQSTNEDKEGLGFVAAQRFRYDSNVFLLPDSGSNAATTAAGQRHDVISTTLLSASYAQRFGLHKLSLGFAPSVVRYLEFDQFDHFAYNALADWSGLVGSDGRYGLRYERTRAASRLADQVQAEKNLVTTDALSADFIVRTGLKWQGVSTWRATRSRNSAVAEQGGDNQGWSGDMGMRFSPGSGNRSDLRYRRSQYRYSNVIPSQLADNNYKQDELELSWLWQVTEPSRLEGRASYLRRRHDHFHERDFSGFVGKLQYVWRPTTTTALTTSMFRELGAITDASASYARTYGFGLAPSWQIDPQWSLAALAEWRYRRYEGYSQIGRPDDRSLLTGLATTYKPTELWALTLGLGEERRRSSDPARTYSAWTASMTARWELR
ncbi:MAG: outer membrane beta-barrel protein [Rhodocyclaceae bacterium]